MTEGITPEPKISEDKIEEMKSEKEEIVEEEERGISPQGKQSIDEDYSGDDFLQESSRNESAQRVAKKTTEDRKKLPSVEDEVEENYDDE